MNINKIINKIMDIKFKNEDLPIIDIILSEIDDEEDLDEFLELIQSHNFKLFRDYIKRDSIDKKYVVGYNIKKNPLNELF